MNVIPVQIERARLEQASILTGIAFSAKRFWRYPESWIQEWSASLTITPEVIATQPTYVALLEGKVAGFYSFNRIDDKSVLLEHLWVEPGLMRSGIGRHLFQHACQLAISSGAKRLEIESDPNAEGFYIRMGAKRTGLHESNVDQTRRSIPILTLDL